MSTYVIFSLIFIAVVWLRAVLDKRDQRVQAAYVEAFKQRGMRAQAPRPALPKGTCAEIAGTDAPEGADGDTTIAEHVGMAFFMTYTDTHGNRTRRRITVRAVRESVRGDILLYSYCHEREEMRSFRADRIKELIDVSTGEAIDGSRIIRLCLAMNDVIEGRKKEKAGRRDLERATARVLRRAKAGLNVLAFLARCDGNIHDGESAIMEEYTRECAAGIVYDTPAAKIYISSLYPDKLGFEESVAALNKKHTKMVAQCAERLIVADGKISAEEDTFIQSLRAATEAAGRKKKRAASS